MPIRKEREPLQKVTVFIFERDFKRIKQLYPEGHTTFLRHLVRAHLSRRDAEITAAGEALADSIDLDEKIEPQERDVEALDIGD